MAIELPFDLVEEILSRVPAKSLAKLRHTCKQWKTLITNPRFVKKHSAHMRCREQQFTIFTGPSSTISCVGIDFDELSNPCLNLEVLKPVSPSELSLYTVNIFHCDGLLGMVTRNKILVMNPLLKQARWINCGPGSDLSMDIFGIGYISNQSSSSCNDYKIVRFPYACPDKVYKFSVYEFKSDCWKDITDPNFNRFFALPYSSVCLNGTPYWISYDQNYSSVLIKSFDFSKERFEPLFLPPSPFKLNDDSSLGIFNGDHLSLLHNPYPCETGKIELWVMKKHWSRLLTVTIPELSSFSFYSSHMIANNSKIVLSGYNLKTNFSTSIYVVGENQECKKLEHPSNMGSIRPFCFYVPSLLQVP